MYVFALLGEEADAALRELLPALEGRVASVRVDATTGDGGTTDGRSTDGGTTAPVGRPIPTDGEGATARVDTAYAVGEGWEATGDGRTLDDVLDGAAPDHEYAVVLDGAGEGAPAAVVDDRTTVVDVPAIVVGDPPERVDEPLLEVDGAASLDVEEAVEAIRATEPHETLESLVAAVKRSPEADYAGAVATFTGRVRAMEDESDDRTRYLAFEKYEEVAERRMRRIESELEDRDGVLEVRLHHRTGRIPDGEDIVFVVVLAGHREEAFATVEDGIDRLKDEVPLFKKEVTEDETFWVHERGE